MQQLEISGFLWLGMKGLGKRGIAKDYALKRRMESTSIERKCLVDFAQMQFQGTKEIATSQHIPSVQLNSNEIGLIL